MTVLKFRSLFLLVVALFIILMSPVTEGSNFGVRISLGALWIILVGVGGSFIASTRRWWKFFGIAILGALIAFTFQGLYPESPIAKVAGITAVALINFLTLIVILRFSLLNATAYPIDRVLAAICGYLILGKLWTAFYGIALVCDPDAIIQFSGGAVGAVDLLYFSLVTLSTLGYGDLVAQNDFVRILAALEAVAGVFYSAVLIAALVAELRIQSAKED